MNALTRTTIARLSSERLHELLTDDSALTDDEIEAIGNELERRERRDSTEHSPKPIAASGAGSYQLSPGSVTFTAYEDGNPDSGHGREVNVRLDSADTALLLYGIVEAFGAANVRNAIDVITAEAGNQQQRIPTRELEGES